MEVDKKIHTVQARVVVPCPPPPPSLVPPAMPLLQRNQFLLLCRFAYYNRCVLLYIIRDKKHTSNLTHTYIYYLYII